MIEKLGKIGFLLFAIGLCLAWLPGKLGWAQGIWVFLVIMFAGIILLLIFWTIPKIAGLANQTLIYLSLDRGQKEGNERYMKNRTKRVADLVRRMLARIVSMSEIHGKEEIGGILWKCIDMILSRAFPPDPDKMMPIREAASRIKKAHEMTLAWIEELNRGGRSFKSLEKAMEKVERRWTAERRWEFDFTDDEFVKEALQEDLARKG